MNIAEAEKNTGFRLEFNNAIEAIDSLLSLAVKTKSSDIHLDPLVDYISVRLRIDGQIQEKCHVNRVLHEEIISRLKILSGTRTDLHFVPQDGRWRTNISGSDYNIRVSFMPTYHGENAVLRLLPAKLSSGNSFSRLGFTPDHVEIISKTLSRTSGIILVTGPTGSGKTTTLHTCLMQIVQNPLSVITLEDPVEYELEGVRQVHIRQEYGVTFAGGLRSALRQDPDVIMVGEIRDGETAKVAIHTALTGHLVLSTLHTNSAIEAVPRLIDMGVDPYLLATTLKLVIAQRLIRIMCRDCDSGGCESCGGCGYVGRSLIAEVVNVDSEMAELIGAKAPVATYFNHAKGRGFRPIEDDGMEKVAWGVTTENEIRRVLYDQS